MKEPIIEIKDLYCNFYTQSGVVRALDGVSLTINKGETLGLVGETGCGKSVTANCVIRLIPQPPGKIEGGNVFFMRPPISKEGKEYLQKKIDELVVNNKEGEEDRFIESLKRQVEDIERIEKLESEIEERIKNNVPDDDPSIKSLEQELRKVNNHYDLLTKSKNYMQKIRGKYISMIFQEPMSALNPVIKVGDQIAEGLLLHERDSLSQSALRTIDSDLASLHNYKHVEMLTNEKNEVVCLDCKAVNMAENTKCSGCGGYFESQRFRTLGKVKLKLLRGVYKSMAADPEKLQFRIMRKIPFVKRIFKPLHREAIDRAVRMLRLVRIPDPHTVVNNYPFELSGGMQQRVMIAIALSCKPQLLIADEPTTALDVTIQAQILKLMNELQQEMGTSILMITHNLGVVAEVCDRVGVMYAGTIVELGEKGSVFKEPLHPYSQGLMNSIPRVNVDLTRLETIEGSVPNLITPPPGCRFHPRCPFVMDVCRVTKPKTEEVRKDHFVACHLYSEARV